jgi:uncharacterized protein YdiU (UPF0061 family)
MSKFVLPMVQTYTDLPEVFYTVMPSEPFITSPTLIHANRALFPMLGLNEQDIHHPDFAAYFSAQKPLPGFDSLAMVYSGHQFGHWAGQLGDGRALLIAQVKTDAGYFDIHLKGSGKTPYSRFGDGRAVLRSCIREYLCSEAMAGLGIPTSRALSLVATHQLVQREEAEPGAVLARVANCHIRFGHFEHFFYHYPRTEYGRLLADYVIKYFFDDLKEAPNRYYLWFERVVQKTAHLIAQWQAAGFCHGVMNTDNMSILGDTIDYGPFGFMEAFDPTYICNHSDESGRYAYDQQPLIGLWNLQALAYSVSSFISDAELTDALNTYWPHFLSRYEDEMAKKLGVASVTDDFRALLYDLLKLMEKNKADYPLTFLYLSDAGQHPQKWLDLFADHDSARQWLSRYHGYSGARVDAVNPKYVLRNWVAETIIRRVRDEGDTESLDGLLTVFQTPYEAHLGFEEFSQPAPDGFGAVCVSCSS